MNERDYWLGFSVFPGIGPTRFASLLRRFGTAKEGWHASKADLEAILGKKLAARFLSFRDVFSLQAYSKKVAENNVFYVTLLDGVYPLLLKEIKNPPFVLYVKGKSKEDCFNSLQHSNTISVVGTRKVSFYGKRVTEMIATDLVKAGFCIVSGLAMGVDAAAHMAALENGGKTIAVLGGGVDACRPKENFLLYEKIITTGSIVISEYPLGTEPTKGSFPSRNRIIAGLSQAVVVTEGAEDSGALITASNAALLKRPVFAVPGPITSSLSKGPNELLRKGATLVTSGEDILREFSRQARATYAGQLSDERFPIPKKEEMKGDTKEEQKIIDLLKAEALSFDELLQQSKFETAKLNMILSIMEMKGFIHQSETGTYFLREL